jgi:radical SAM protein with 4Fe4S-binding SPASM domain
MTRPMGEMSDDLFYKIIREGKEMGVRSYSPFLNGEPFVFPRIWQWLDYMEKENVKVSLFTNAEKVDVDRLLTYSNIEYVNCSLNAATEETYNKIMRGPKFDVVKKNIDELLERTPMKKPFGVRVSFVQTEDNVHEIDQFKSMYKKNRRKICEFCNWTGDRQSSLAKVGKRVPCWVLLHQMFVLWDGSVVPCCQDYDAKMILGDANKNSLREIWESYAWMRRKHRRLDFDIPVCSKCNHNVG